MKTSLKNTLWKQLVATENWLFTKTALPSTSAAAAAAAAGGTIAAIRAADDFDKLGLVVQAFLSRTVDAL